ncbi:two-component regulator propeller domain-containing protein [Hymenobacter sp. B81]|uniref:sensor histidine kinase n=1 Tax=Hymenobacter sp. B81 TaxID=3344878 RepID=UPI0037DCCEE7
MTRISLSPPAWLSWLLCCLSWTLAGAAPPPENLTFHPLTTAQGLSENSVLSAVQDRRGFLWLGTQDGLNRYDGAGFRVFRNDPQRAGSLSSNFILALAADAHGNVWVGTGGGGLCRYQPLADRFVTYQASDSSGLTDNFVRAVFCDRRGRVWAGAETGLHLLDQRTGRFRLFRHPDLGNVRRNSIRAILQAADGRIWVGTGEGRLSYVDERRGLLVPLTDWVPQAPITALAATPQGDLWVGVENAGLYFVGLRSGQRRSYQPGPAPGALPSDAVRSLLVDGQERLWVGTMSGLCRFNPGTGTFANWQHRAGAGRTLPNNTVLTLYEDRLGLLWAGTEQGLASFEPRPNAFSQPVPQHETGPVWALAEDAGRQLWLGTENMGLLRLNPVTRQLTRYRHDPADPTSLPDDFVRAVLPDRDGRIWVGTQSHGLAYLDPATGRFRRYRHNPADPTSLSDDNVRCIYQDRQGRLWVGTEGGLNLLDPVTGRCAAYRHNPRDPRSLSSNFVRCVYQDHRGNVWVGVGGGGLCRFDPRNGTSHAFRANPADPRSLSSNFVRCMYEDEQNRLWLATEGGGLSCLLDPEAGRFQTFREPQGLPNDVIYGMLPDGQGDLWLATNKGIARFTPRTRRFRTYDVRDGLPQDEFNAGAFCRRRDGSLLFGGGNGVVEFQPTAVRYNPAPPVVVFTGFRKFNQPARLDTSITERRTLRLAPRDYFFSIEFAALNYRLPDKNRFSYKMEGFDDEWIEAGGQHQATYTNLDPGSYTFRVRAANNDGVWNPTGAALKVVVEPPWYQTWWFRILASWVVFGLLFAAYRLRVSQLLALERVRHNIARDLHDDMGSTLSSISILSQLARNHQQRNNQEQASALLEQIGDSSRRMLDSMDDIVWAINPAHDSMDAVAARMRSFASDVLEARGIDFTFKVAPEVLEQRLPMRARREFFLLFKEAVNNLAKYAQAEFAAIRLDYEQRQLVLRVEDDGVGFDPQAPAQGGGNGMTNMRSRAAALKATLNLDTAPGQGTRLELRVPLK